jgi:hypothetical protein
MASAAKQSSLASGFWIASPPALLAMAAAA